MLANTLIADRALKHQMDIENKCNQPRRRDLTKLREWHTDSDFGKGALLRTVEDVWDSQEHGDASPRSASNYIAAASTGDALSYLFGGWYLRTRTKLEEWKDRRVPHPAVPEAGLAEKQELSEKVKSLDADDALRVTKGILTVLASGKSFGLPTTCVGLPEVC